MSPMRSMALALRLVLEVCALVALGFWGWQTGQTLPMKLGLGIGVPLVAAVVWGLLVSPKASIAAPRAVRLIIELVIFALAVLGLLAVDRSHIAWALGIAYLIHRVLLFVADR